MMRAMQTATPAKGKTSPVVELEARQNTANSAIFKLLQDGVIVVLRDVPEIHELGSKLQDVAERLRGDRARAVVAELMRAGDVPSLDTLSVFYHAFRHLRDSRYVSALFADFVSSFDLPQPLLIDAGHCRMAVPHLAKAASARPDLFDPAEFAPRHPNEAEGMIVGETWGNAHRDIDVRHYHYQINFWFPLHDLEAQRSLLLFPASYRRDVPQYGPLANPDDPDGWGFGPAVSVPLRFGDMLIFHSQQLHASPSKARHRSRLTVELRVASGCLDDNASIYRRLFWNSRNFLPGTGGETAQSVLYGLFNDPAQYLAAGHALSTPDTLDGIATLDAGAWSRVVARLDECPAGEDLCLLVARVAFRQRQTEAASAAICRIRDTTESYFWALEAGRVASEGGFKQMAISCFERSLVLASRSRIRLDRYTGRMPVRSKEYSLQLLPRQARRAARVFLATINSDHGQSSYDCRAFIARETLAMSLKRRVAALPGASRLRAALRATS
jgi:hypothetical protein